jgi:hypothetical protein
VFSLGPYREVKELGPPGWGSLKNRDNKICSWVPWDSDLRKDALAMPGKDLKLQTRLLVREGTQHEHTRNSLKIIKDRRGKDWSRVPDGCLTLRQTGRLTDGRNITLTLMGSVWNACEELGDRTGFLEVKMPVHTNRGFSLVI